MRDSRLARLVVIDTVTLWPACSVPADGDTDTFPMRLSGSAMDQETGPSCAVIVSELPSSGVSTTVAGDTLIVPGAGGLVVGGLVVGGTVAGGTVAGGPGGPVVGGLLAGVPPAGGDADCPAAGEVPGGGVAPPGATPPPEPGALTGALPGALTGALPGAGLGAPPGAEPEGGCPGWPGR